MSASTFLLSQVTLYCFLYLPVCQCVNGCIEFLLNFTHCLYCLPSIKALQAFLWWRFSSAESKGFYWAVSGKPTCVLSEWLWKIFIQQQHCSCLAAKFHVGKDMTYEMILCIFHCLLIPEQGCTNVFYSLHWSFSFTGIHTMPLNWNMEYSIFSCNRFYSK